MNVNRFTSRLRSLTLVFSVAGLLLFSHCQRENTYTIHIGQSFYPLNQLAHERFYGQDMLRNSVGDTVHIRGIYTAADSVYIDFPMLRYYKTGSGLRYAYIDTVLDVHDGDLVEIEGTVVRKMIRVKGTKVSYKEELLKPDRYKTVSPSHKLKSVVQKEYLSIKDELQKEITAEDSQLILSEKPRWFVVWSETENRYIVTTRFVDLMYQAEIDFVIGRSQQKLTDVYAVEWFKGE